MTTDIERRLARELPDYARVVLDSLEAAGYEAWVVGGWVRDALLGRPGHDVDVTTSAPWQDTARVLRACGIEVHETGTAHGTVTAVVDGRPVETTTYRVEGAYSDRRHPDEVRFVTDVREDLARRDFTVNAMAWHPVRGLLDCFDGAGDLERREIRAVGEPRRRFEEDALRMLRAVRFACRLDFTIEPATAAALASCAPLLDAVARERVGWELEGILATGRAGDALVRHPEIMCAAIPELAPCRGFGQHSRYHVYDVYEHTARVLSVAGEEARGRGAAAAPSPSLMWAALLHDVEKPSCFTLDERGNGHFYGHPELSAKTARVVMERLSCPKELVRDACLLIRYHDRPLEAERRSLLRMMSCLAGAGVDTIRLMNELFVLKRADTFGKVPSCFYYVEEIERMREVVRELVATGEAYSLSTLDLSGRDLIEAGVKPGRQVGELLQRALDAAIDGVVPNDRSALLAYLNL